MEQTGPQGSETLSSGQIGPKVSETLSSEYNTVESIMDIINRLENDTLHILHEKYVCYKEKGVYKCIGKTDGKEIVVLSEDEIKDLKNKYEIECIQQ